MTRMHILIGAMAAICATAGSAQVARSTTPVSQSAPSDPAKVKCKSHVEIGSLAKMIKECHTLAEWDAINRAGRDQADTYRQTFNSSRSN